MQILTDIDTILCYSDQDGIGSELRREGIDTILMCGRGAIELPPGSLRTLHQRLNILLGKNGSATPTDRIKIRCIGALGLVRRRYGNIQLE
ncbi:hypothetical protein H6768_00455 [Candidatus Peribacteria bacterium]|nr:hypothetical protein [Candidatus Peribacteria bacterium]